MTMTNGPSEHLTWDELACHDELRTPYLVDWRKGRGLLLAGVFEHIREALGNKPLRILSAYRTPEHNKAIGGVSSSQHVQGRALDLSRGSEDAADFHVRVNDCVSMGRLGGIGYYPWGVHVDIRARNGGPLAVWSAMNKGSRG